jgi:hypothetical protein
MKLPIPSIFNKKKEKEYLLALLTREEKISAVIIEQTDANSQIIGSQQTQLPQLFEDISQEELLKILDRTISSAEQTLPPNMQSQKTIFGVPTNWIEDNHMKKAYQAKLKDVTAQLGLTPIGFIEIPQAIIRLMQEEEGAPVSAILTEIGKKHLSLSVIRAGRIIETKQALLEDKPPIIVDTLLKTFTEADVLPSRIVVLNEGHDEHLIQSFISHHWTRSLPFLHVPQISLLPLGFDERAVVYGTALQLGLSVKDTSLLSHQAIKTFDPQTATHPHETTQEEPRRHVAREPILPTGDDLKEIKSLESFGFVKDVDVSETREKSIPIQQEETVIEEKQKEEAEEKTEETTASSDNFINTTFPIQGRNVEKEDIQTKEFHMPKMPQTLMSLSSMIPKNLAGKKFVFILPVLLLFLIGIVILYAFLLHATIIVDVTPKVVDQTEQISFSISGVNDFSQNIIKAASSTTAISGSQTTNATGKKDTGTKAKGTITIFNSDTAKKQISEGTALKSSNNLEFVTDKDATISSASGDIFTGIKSGTTQVTVTAKQIGSEYNIPSNTKFTLGENQSLAGKNDQAFSGGTKKTVTVVAKDDVDKLTQLLPSVLEQKARDAIGKKIPASNTLLTILPDFKPSKKDFSAQVGDEAKTVSLNSSVTFEGVIFDNDDLLQFAKTLIKNKFDQDLTVSDNNIKNTLKNVKQKDENTVKATLIINAKLLPKIDAAKLQEQLAGKSFDQAEETFKQFPQVNNVDITLFPPLPLPKLLPRQSENITITVKAND